MNNEPTLEELFCERHVKPEIDDLIRTVNIIANQHPKDVKELSAVIKLIKDHQYNLSNLLNRLKSAASADKPSDDISSHDA
ncbi:MAG: hypothetical protein OXI43_04365 [Candidatus Poribacteria bacterium]|nr:hypothetical protein [Candidatus Poribacteria bacterium]